jgi:hypothetical protein
MGMDVQGRPDTPRLFAGITMANIRIPRGDSLGKNRSEHEENLRKEWGSTMTDSQLDKLKYLEKKIKEKTGQSKTFIRGQDIDEIK